MSVQTVESWLQLKSYLPHEQMSIGQSGSPMGHWPWMTASMEKLRLEGQILIKFICGERGVTSLATLVKRPGLGQPLELLGVKLHGEPGDFCYQDQEELERLVQSLVQDKNPLLFFRVPSESPLVTTLESAYKGRALIRKSIQKGCPYLLLKDWRPSSSLHSDLRRARRKAQAIGEVTFEIHRPREKIALDDLWPLCLEVESSGWKGRAESALLKDDSLGDFYYTYAQKAADQGILRLCLMKIDGRVVAMQIALEYAQSFWLLKIGHLESLGHCSPGLLLLEHTLLLAQQQGLKSYEFLGHPAPWIQRWSKEERENVYIKVYPYSLSGMIFFTRDFLNWMKQKIRRIYV